MFCKKCGNEIDNTAEFCPKCGTPVNGSIPPAQPVMPVMYQQPYVVYQTPKAPGSGLSTAGMVLGIIAIVYAFLTIIGVTEYNLRIIYYGRAAFAFGAVLIQSVLALVGLPLSVSGNIKHKNPKAITGIILCTITLAISLIIFIYIVSV